ncbi:MAG: hypothetical protein R3D89_00195 [Sphingomonadaceae bacterium]
MKKLNVFAALAATSLAFAVPQAASAQDAWPMESGDWVEVAGIHVDDGHGLDYANHIAGQWRKGQDFAKAQGWISNYQVMTNPFPRKGEPDVYLITWFPSFADKAEEKKRDEAYRKHMAMTDEQMQAASGKRAEYRKVGSTMLLRVQNWKK